MSALTSRLLRAILITAATLFVFLVLLLLEASGGHDGWLCEWGYDSDGAGTATSGCG